MKSNPFNLDKSYADWDSIHYETVCIVIAKRSVDADEVVEGMIFAICQAGILKDGDSFRFSKAGDMIVIGKACANIQINYEDTIN